MNCQMNSGVSQVTPYLNLAPRSWASHFDAIMRRPYYSMGCPATGLARHGTVAAFNLYDDDQACRATAPHDITYDPNGIVIVDAKHEGRHRRSTTPRNGKSCILIGYEGGIEYAAPTGAANHDSSLGRSSSTTPTFTTSSKGWYKILQDRASTTCTSMALGSAGRIPGPSITSVPRSTVGATG